MRLIRGPQVGRETLKLGRLLLALPLSLAETAFERGNALAARADLLSGLAAVSAGLG